MEIENTLRQVKLITENINRQIDQKETEEIDFLFPQYPLLATFLVEHRKNLRLSLGVSTISLVRSIAPKLSDMVTHESPQAIKNYLESLGVPNVDLAKIHEFKQDFYFNKLNAEIRDVMLIVGVTDIHFTHDSKSIKLSAKLHNQRSTTQFLIDQLNLAFKEKKVNQFKKYLGLLGVKPGQTSLIIEKLGTNFSPEEILATDQMVSTAEVVTKNPRKKKADITTNARLLRFIKLAAKVLNKDTLYNEIIPMTAKHGSWTLGAQLLDSYLDDFKNKAESKGREFLRVSMVTDGELNRQDNNLLRIKWFDHGTLDVTTGFNQTTDGMVQFQRDLAKSHLQKNIYCHCIAGKSRSMFETIAYLHINREKLFDFADRNWEPILVDIKNKYLAMVIEKNLKKEPQYLRNNSYGRKKIYTRELSKAQQDSGHPAQREAENLLMNLKSRLMNNPSIMDIGEFVHLRRPKTKPLNQLEGDQGGLLGLLALNDIVENLDYYERFSRTPSEAAKKFNDAQSVALMLMAPLDRAYREENDLRQQQTNFIKVYKSFMAHEPAVNLLLAMISSSSHGNYVASAKTNAPMQLGSLKVGEQAKLAIHLAWILEAKKQDSSLDVAPFLEENALAMARAAIANAKTLASKKDQLTAGDKIELLRTFGSSIVGTRLDQISYEEIAKDILSSKSGVNRYHAGIQLAELVMIMTNQNRHGFLYQIRQMITKDNQLTLEEQREFMGALQNENRIREYSFHFGKALAAKNNVNQISFDSAISTDSQINNLNEDRVEKKMAWSLKRKKCRSILSFLDKYFLQLFY